MLEVKNLYKEFNNRPILKDISFTLKDGEIMTIVGPSGAGKTTLLRIIAGLETKDSGEILIDGPTRQGHFDGAREGQIQSGDVV